MQRIFKSSNFRGSETKYLSWGFLSEMAESCFQPFLRKNNAVVLAEVSLEV